MASALDTKRNRIWWERMRRRWSQTDLADKCGVSQQIISNAEGGAVSDTLLERLAHVLKVYPPHVLRKEVQPAFDPEERPYALNGPVEAGQV